VAEAATAAFVDSDVKGLFGTREEADHVVTFRDFG
jgi:hypothetical protein